MSSLRGNQAVRQMFTTHGRRGRDDFRTGASERASPTAAIMVGAALVVVWETPVSSTKVPASARAGRKRSFMIFAGSCGARQRAFSRDCGGRKRWVSGAAASSRAAKKLRRWVWLKSGKAQAPARLRRVHALPAWSRARGRARAQGAVRLEAPRPARDPRRRRESAKGLPQKPLRPIARWSEARDGDGRCSCCCRLRRWRKCSRRRIS